MSLNDDYLKYPQRGYGMDHDRYDWSMLSERQPVQLPEGKRLALWVNVCLQYFPLNQKGEPFKVPGGMTMPYPDLRHYSLRDYGNRVGIYRVLDALDQAGIQPTFAANTRLLERAPALAKLLRERGDEVNCHGWHMDALHYGGQPIDEERELVRRSVDGLEQLIGRKVRGWLSPARNESENTPELLAEQGLEYFCDWVNDDMPYRFRTDKGPLVAMPLSNEIEDVFVIQNNQHSEDSWVEQVSDAAALLLEEAQTQGGRILSLNIHPWLLGQPHRISRLERVLQHLSEESSVWTAPAGEILDCWNRQQA